MPKSTDSRNNVQEILVILVLSTILIVKVKVFFFSLEEMFLNFQPIQIRLANNF